MANPNLLNVSMNSNMLQNLNYSGPINKMVKNNIQNNSMNLNNKLSLSSQGAKNTIPNFNINQIDNLNNVFVPNKMNQPGIPIMLNPLLNRQNFSSQTINNLNNNILNNIQNNSLMKNEQNNSQVLFNRDINNYNNKTYKHSGRKKDLNHDNNEENDIRKRNNFNKMNENNTNNRLRSKDNHNNFNNSNSNKKNRKKPILIVKFKNGKNIIDIEINENVNIENEITKKIKEKINIDGKILNLLQNKIKESIEKKNKIFEKPMDVYSYKKMSNIHNLLFNEIRNSKNNNNIVLRRSNSVRNNYYYINEMNNIKPALCDIQKSEILSNSFHK